MFLQKAGTGENQWWRYLLTTVIVIAGVLIGQTPLFLIVNYRATALGLGQDEIMEMAGSLDLSPIGIGLNGTLLLALLAFIGGLLALWLCVVHLHKKPFRLMITPARAIHWQKIFFGFGLWIGLAVLAELAFYAIYPMNYTFRFDPVQFMGLVAVSILLLPLQTSFEELFFRGYFMQGISLIAPFRWIPLVLTSAAFGLMHWMNPEVQAFGAGLTMVYYIGVGLFLGIVTLMDDSLELALGVHAATNIFGAMFVTFDDAALKTAALFHVGVVDMGGMLIAFFVCAAVFIWVVSKKYQWRDWTKWYGKIERQQIEPAERFVTD